MQSYEINLLAACYQNCTTVTKDITVCDNSDNKYHKAFLQVF